MTDNTCYAFYLLSFKSVQTIFTARINRGKLRTGSEMIKSPPHCVSLYLMYFEKDISDFYISFLRFPKVEKENKTANKPKSALIGLSSQTG